MKAINPGMSPLAAGKMQSIKYEGNIPAKHVEAFHPKNVWQENRITRSDSCVLDSEYQRGTN